MGNHVHLGGRGSSGVGYVRRSSDGLPAGPVQLDPPTALTITDPSNNGNIVFAWTAPAEVPEGYLITTLKDGVVMDEDPVYFGYTSYGPKSYGLYGEYSFHLTNLANGNPAYISSSTATKTLRVRWNPPTDLAFIGTADGVHVSWSNPGAIPSSGATIACSLNGIGVLTPTSIGPVTEYDLLFGSGQFAVEVFFAQEGDTLESSHLTGTKEKLFPPASVAGSDAGDGNTFSLTWSNPGTVPLGIAIALTSPSVYNGNLGNVSFLMLGAGQGAYSGALFNQNDGSGNYLDSDSVSFEGTVNPV